MASTVLPQVTTIVEVESKAKSYIVEVAKWGVWGGGWPTLLLLLL